MKKALGKGLSSLIPDNYLATLAQGSVPEHGIQNKPGGLEWIPLSEIAPNPDQPREYFSPEAIEELATSIREKGILQPAIVKKKDFPAGGQKYELVCGERRLKAALLAGLEKVPVVVRELAESDLLEWALIENIQREDLNPLEEARAYERLCNERGLSQEEVAKKIGKNRTTVTNTLRLLRLPEEILGHIREGRISEGHARSLLGLFTAEQQLHLARRIIKENLSVRQTEEIVARSGRKRRAKAARLLTPEVADLENRLAHLLGTQVKILTSRRSSQGRIVIHYYSLDDLDRILRQINLPPG